MFYRVEAGHGLPHDPLKAIVAPRPIGWISTLSKAGTSNLAPYSFCNLLADKPALVGFSSQGRKDTLTFAQETGEFVFNLATWDDRAVVNASSAPYEPAVSEFAELGIASLPGTLVSVPRVASSPAALECQWVETIVLKAANGDEAGYFLVIGEVVGVHIDERFLVDGLVDTAAMHPLMRGGYRDFFDAGEASAFAMARPAGGGRRDGL